MATNDEIKQRPISMFVPCQGCGATTLLMISVVGMADWDCGECGAINRLNVRWLKTNEDTNGEQ